MIAFAFGFNSPTSEVSTVPFAPGELPRVPCLCQRRSFQDKRKDHAHRLFAPQAGRHVRPDRLDLSVTNHHGAVLDIRTADGDNPRITNCERASWWNHSAACWDFQSAGLIPRPQKRTVQLQLYRCLS